MAGTTDELRCVSFADIEWLFREAVPKFTGKGKSGNGHDTSRSGAAFRAGAILRDDGASYEEMREALLEHEDPDIAEWARTKGLANNERELKRIYGKTSDKTPTLTEDALALIFAARRADDMRFIAAWSKWLSWDGAHWEPDDTLACFDEARAICREKAAGAKPRTAAVLASAKTVAAVERLANRTAASPRPSTNGTWIRASSTPEEP